MSAAKPVLRGLLNSQIKKNLFIAIGLGMATGAVFNYTVCVPFKQKHIDFYKAYDIEKEFNRMRNAGVFDSCEPDA